MFRYIIMIMCSGGLHRDYFSTPGKIYWVEDGKPMLNIGGVPIHLVHPDFQNELDMLELYAAAKLIIVHPRETLRNEIRRRLNLKDDYVDRLVLVQEEFVKCLE